MWNSEWNHPQFADLVVLMGIPHERHLADLQLFLEMITEPAYILEKNGSDPLTPAVQSFWSIDMPPANGMDLSGCGIKPSVVSSPSGIGKGTKKK